MEEKPTLIILDDPHPAKLTVVREFERIFYNFIEEFIQQCSTPEELENVLESRQDMIDLVDTLVETEVKVGALNMLTEQALAASDAVRILKANMD